MMCAPYRERRSGCCCRRSSRENLRDMLPEARSASLEFLSRMQIRGARLSCSRGSIPTGDRADREHSLRWKTSVHAEGRCTGRRFAGPWRIRFDGSCGLPGQRCEGRCRELSVASWGEGPDISVVSRFAVCRMAFALYVVKKECEQIIGSEMILSQREIPHTAVNIFLTSRDERIDVQRQCAVFAVSTREDRRAQAGVLWRMTGRKPASSMVRQ